MHDAHAFLQNIALVLCVAAVTTVLFQRLRQPVVFGYPPLPDRPKVWVAIGADGTRY